MILVNKKILQKYFKILCITYRYLWNYYKWSKTLKFTVVNPQVLPKREHFFLTSSRNNFINPFMCAPCLLRVCRTTSANVFMLLRSSASPFFLVSWNIEYFFTTTVIIVVLFTSAVPLKSAEDTRYFERTGHPFSPASSSCNSEISKRTSGSAARRLLRLSIEAFRTWAGYLVDFPGSSVGLIALLPRCDYEFFRTILVFVLRLRWTEHEMC